MFPVEAFQASLGKAADIFRQLGIRFHLTGGVTSVLYGEPRLTQVTVSAIVGLIASGATPEERRAYYSYLEAGDNRDSGVDRGLTWSMRLELASP